MRARISVASGETFRSLRNRNFRLFFVGQLITQTGTWLTMVALTLLVLSIGGSGMALGTLTAAQFGPILILGAWSGAIADRYDKRRLLMTTQVAGMTHSAVIGSIVLAGTPSLGTIYVLALIQGVITAFDNPARRSFVVEMVEAPDLPNAVSLNSAIMTGARVVGPALAGVLVMTVGYGWTFILDSVSYLGVLAGLVLMRPAELFRSAPTPRAPGQIRDGLRYVRSTPELVVPLVMATIIGALALNFSVTIPVLVDGPLGGDRTTFTLLFSVLSLGSMVAALATARRSEVTVRHVIVGAGAFGLAMFGLALAPTLPLAFLAALLLGMASMLFLTSSTSLVQLLAGPEYRGRVLAIQTMVFFGSAPFGGPLLGWLADFAGPRSAVLLGGVACLAAAAYGIWRLDPWDRHSHSPDPRDLPGLTVTGEVTLAD